MDPFPHHYNVSASAEAEGDVRVESPGLPALVSAAPREFGGPGDRWSPETLIVACVADCFVLTFRSVAAASKLSWVSLRCEAEGVLDRVERTLRFTTMNVHAVLRVPAETSEERAQRILEKAEQVCLVTNSLNSEIRFSTSVEIVA